MRILCSARLVLVGLTVAAVLPPAAAGVGPLRPIPVRTPPAKVKAIDVVPKTEASLPASTYPWAQLGWVTAGVPTVLSSASSGVQPDWRSLGVVPAQVGVTTPRAAASLPASTYPWAQVGWSSVGRVVVPKLLSPASASMVQPASIGR